jgi:hypothetical protein
VLANKDDYPSSTVKQANFARNAKGWKKKKAFPGATIAMALPGVIQGIQNIREQKQQEKSAKESADVSKLFSHLRDPRFTTEKDIALPFIGTNYDQGTTYVADTGISILGKMWPGLDKANKTLGEYGFTPERVLGFANQTGGGYTQTPGSIGTGIGGPLGGAIGTVAGLLFDSGHKKRMKRYEDEYNQNAWYLTQSAPLYAKKGAVVAEKGSVSVGDLTKIADGVYDIGGRPHSEGGTPLEIKGQNVSPSNSPIKIEAEDGEILVHLKKEETLDNSETGESAVVVFGNMKVPGTKTKFKDVAEDLAKEQRYWEEREKRATGNYYPGSPGDISSKNSNLIAQKNKKRFRDAIQLLAELQTRTLEKTNPENVINQEKIAKKGNITYLSDKPYEKPRKYFPRKKLENFLVSYSEETPPDPSKESTSASDSTYTEKTPVSIKEELTSALESTLPGEKVGDLVPHPQQEGLNPLYFEFSNFPEKDKKEKRNSSNQDATKKLVGDTLNVASSLLPLLRNPRYRTPRIPYELIGQIRPEMVPMPEDPRLMPITPVSGNELELVRAIAAATQTQDRRGTTPFAEQKIQEIIDYRNNLYDQAIKAQAENVGRYNAMAAQTQSIAANINAANARTKMDAQTARINMMLDFVKAEQMAQRDRNTLRMTAQAFPNYYFGPDGGLRFVPNFGAIADMFNTKSDSRETQDS